MTDILDSVQNVVSGYLIISFAFFITCYQIAWKIIGALAEKNAVAFESSKLTLRIHTL